MVEWLVSVTEKLGDGLLVVDSTGTITCMNDVLSEQLGLDNKLVGQPVVDFLERTSMKETSRDFDHWKQWIRMGGLRCSPIQICHGGDQKTTVLLTGWTQDDEYGKPLIVVVMRKPVAGSPWEEIAWNAKLDQIQSLASVETTFSDFAHDLNNPLHFIKGFNRQIKSALEKHKSVTEEQIGDFVNEIDQASQRMEGVVRDLRESVKRESQAFGVVNIEKVDEKLMIDFGHPGRILFTLTLPMVSLDDRRSDAA